MQVFRLRQIELLELLLRTGAVFLQAGLQHPAVIDRYMRVARGDIPFRLDDTQIIEDLGRCRHCRQAAVLGRIVLPEGGNVAQHLLIFLGDIEAVAVPLVKLVQFFDHPIHRIFREDRGCTVAGRLVPSQKRLRLDEDAHPSQNVAVHQRAANRQRLIHILTVGLCGDLRTLHANHRFGIQKFLAKIVHPRGQFSKMAHKKSS